LWLCRQLVAQTFRGSRATTRLRKGAGTFNIRASIFCAVRERAAFPMCAFYRSALERFLQKCEIDAAVDLNQCRASGDAVCTMAVTIRGEFAERPAAEAA
jgi:hypothetical protein